MASYDSTMRLLRSFVALPAARRLLLVRAFVTVALVRAALWLFSFARICTTLERVSRNRGIDADAGTSALTIPEVEWAVTHVARLVPRATCLTQALAIRAILARAGVACTISIGVALPAGDSLRAHAWIEPANAALAKSRQFPDFVPLVGPGRLISDPQIGSTTFNQHEVQAWSSQSGKSPANASGVRT